MNRKRDMDLIRSLMLEIESGRTDFDPDFFGDNGERDAWAKTSMHLQILDDDKLVVFDREADGLWIVIRILPKGYDFLDGMRDPDIWERAKTGATKVGSFTADTLLAIAKGYIKQKAQQVLGVEIET